VPHAAQRPRRSGLVLWRDRLDDETCERIRDRLVTPDADAEARRADLRAKRDARPADDDLRAVMDYVLGD